MRKRVGPRVLLLKGLLVLLGCSRFFSLCFLYRADARLPPLLAQHGQTPVQQPTPRPSRAPAQTLACPARISEYSAVALWRLQLVAPHELTRARQPTSRPVAAHYKRGPHRRQGDGGCFSDGVCLSAPLMGAGPLVEGGSTPLCCLDQPARAVLDKWGLQSRR